MIIDCYFIAFNESETIHLTINHYKQFCRNIYVYDNFSTDNTREIAESMGCIVRQFGVAGQLNDAEYLKVKNNCWKGSDADWVIVCDSDEILKLDADDIELLKVCYTNEYSVIYPFGYSMFSNSIPKENWLEINTGIDDDNYSKKVCFRPDKVYNINYVYGCHGANPNGVIKQYRGFNLLHYKHVGGAKRIADRHALYASRMSDFNKKWKLGYQYEEARQKTIDYFNENLAKARPLW